MPGKIRQGTMPPAMRGAFPGFLDRWGLRDYSNPDEPVVVFGCYGQRELRLLREHRSLAVLVWLGTDVTITGRRRLWERRQRSIRHVAIGAYIAADLERLGVPYERINLYGSPLLDRLQPAALGRAVYAYVPEARRQFFGGDLVDAVREAVPEIDFIVHPGAVTPSAEMPGVYRRCYLGLRLTAHDGGCETGIELGLMGRRVVYNGDLPNALPWSSVADVVDHVRREQKRPADPQDVARSVREFVQWSDDWLEVDRWEVNS